ncbi:MAG TPA: xanthine dehydrogenase family protein molybdopterin-binding subunit [Actinomycetes bacterium]|jgi:carbon-monoxide dehydrogenase large subunit|nr:xanthine dehydrogenase family protein molybdopterin-binding subunit [Actinomycetes bacterium]
MTLSASQQFDSPLGKPVPRTEDRRLVTGQGRYVADLPLQGAAQVVFIGSPIAHARVVGIDTTQATSAPGVLAVVTAADLGLEPMPPLLPIHERRMVRPWLADGVVRHVGEPVVAVVATEQAHAVDAAELVEIDYDPLDVVVDPRAAARDEVLLFPEVGSNTCMELPSPPGPDLFDGCEVVVGVSMTHQRMAACPIEPRCAAAAWGEDGRLTFWASTQAPHRLRDQLASALGLEPGSVRVVVGEVGGAFGAKPGTYREEVLVGWLARHLGRPLKWVEARSGSMVGMFHGRGLIQDLELGGRRDGTLLAYRVRVLQDAGAYPQFGGALVLRAKVLASGVYAIPRVECGGRAVLTNTTPIGPIRGAGRPEANIAIERAVDRFATEIGMDPVEVRRRNMIPAGAFPHTTATGTTYDSGDYRALLDTVVSAGGYGELRAEQDRRRAAGDPLLLGVGLGMFVEVADPTGHGEYGAVEITADGGAAVRTGSSAHGQGHQTTWAQIVADRLGIPMDRVEVRYGDTDLVPAGIGTFGSRSAQAGGGAVQRVAVQVLEQARRLAAELLEADPADVTLDRATGRLHLVGSPERGHTWAELAKEAASRDTTLRAEVLPGDEQAPPPAWPSGAVLAAVEVDSETGVVRIRKLVTCDDAGRVLNPLIVTGQVHGGLAWAVAHALLEEFVYDEDGNPRTANFGDYGVITADALPRYELHEVVSPAPGNELGVKGVGEAGTVGAPAAILNAVVDALAHLGVRHVDPPATPEKVLRAITEARH